MKFARSFLTLPLWLAMASIVVVGSSRNQTPAPKTNPTAKTIADYQDRVKAYLDAQRKLSSGIAKLPDKATPQQIDTRQRELGKLVMSARKGVKRGEIFGADMTALIRRLLAPLFKGPDGAKVRAAIYDEPHPVIPEVNIRYPDDVPLSTMPPDIMKLLPSVDPALEYRFIGRHLILLDVDAHLIIDVIDNAIPG